MSNVIHDYVLISKNIDDLELSGNRPSIARKAKRFVRWFVGEVGTLGESETYTITRVSWDSEGAVYNNSQNETYSAHGVAWRTGEKHREVIERGRVFYASL